MRKTKQTVWMELKEEVLEALNLLEEVTDEQVLEVIDKVLKTSALSRTMSLDERCALRLELFHSIRRLDVLEKLLEDDSVTEIMINGENGIFLEREGEFGSLYRREDIQRTTGRIGCENNRDEQSYDK